MIEIIEYGTNEFNNANAIIKICYYVSLFFLSIIAILIIYLKNLRDRLKIKERIEATYFKKYESVFIEYLYASESVEITLAQRKTIEYLKKSAKNKLKRKLIIQTFLKLKNEISGETAAAIQNLYCEIGFVDGAMSKLRSRKWDNIARAIRELSQFEIKEAHGEIIQLINHSKIEVRNEIQKYLVKLFGFKGLEFLDVLKNQLSEWDQIQILEILNKCDTSEIPDLTKWLLSSNDSVVSFTIKLTKIYNQTEANDTIITLFDHRNPEIRLQAIDAIDRLGIYEAVALLKETVFLRSMDEQVAFFKVLEEVSTSTDIEFIKEFANHENFYIRVSVMKILNLITVDADNTFKIISTDFSIDKNLTLAS